MKQSDFIEAIKKTGGYSSHAEAVVVAKVFIETVKDILRAQDTVTLPGLGTFSTVSVKEKRGKIPGTDRKYVKAPHIAPHFKFSAALKKEAVFN